MITNEIGMNAGKIWNLLAGHDEQSIKELKKKTKMSDADFYMAIGWLARECKIFQYKKDQLWMISLIE